MRRRQRKSEARLERVHRQHHYVEGERPEPNAIVDCGWGRLLFANTFDDVDHLVSEIRAEGPEQRDIAIYVSDPHVLIGTAPRSEDLREGKECVSTCRSRGSPYQ